MTYEYARETARDWIRLHLVLVVRPIQDFDRNLLIINLDPCAYKNGGLFIVARCRSAVDDNPLRPRPIKTWPSKAGQRSWPIRSQDLVRSTGFPTQRAKDH